MIASNCARYSGVKRLPSFEKMNSRPCFGPSWASTRSAQLGEPPRRLMTLCSKLEDLVKNNTRFRAAAPRTGTTKASKRTGDGAWGSERVGGGEPDHGQAV